MIDADEGKWPETDPLEPIGKGQVQFQGRTVYVLLPHCITGENRRAMMTVFMLSEGMPNGSRHRKLNQQYQTDKPVEKNGYILPFFHAQCVNAY